MLKSKEHTYFFPQHLKTLKDKMFSTKGHTMRILNLTKMEWPAFPFEALY